MRSNIMRTPDAEFAGPAIQLIKDERLAEYRISVEADSLSAMDWAQERDSAVQFMSAMGAFVAQIGPMIQTVPGSSPYFLRLLQWSVSKFKVSSEIEGVLDQAVAQLQANPPQPPQPSAQDQAETAAEVARAKEREASAIETQVDTQTKIFQLNQMSKNAAQPTPNLPPIIG